MSNTGLVGGYEITVIPTNTGHNGFASHIQHHEAADERLKGGSGSLLRAANRRHVFEASNMISAAQMSLHTHINLETAKVRGIEQSSFDSLQL